MDRVKIQEISKEAGVSNSNILKKATELGFEIKGNNSLFSMEEAEILINYSLTGIKPKELKNKQIKVKKKSISGITIKSKNEPKGKIKISTVPTEKEIKEKKNKEESAKRIEKILKEDDTIKKLDIKPRKEISIKVKEKENNSFIKKKKGRGQTEHLGITIIKKSKRVIPKVTMVVTPHSKKNTIGNLDSERNSKKKKKSKKILSKIKDSGIKMDLLNERLLGTNMSDSIYEKEEIVLLDFSEKNIYENKHNTNNQNKKANNKPVKSQFKQPFSMRRKGKKKKYIKDEVRQNIELIEIPENIRVYEFAEKINKNTSEIIKILFSLGTMVTQNDFLDKDSIEILAEEFEVEVSIINPLDALDYISNYNNIPNVKNITRAPIVTIMGHVDHGKTSLLDKIRSTKYAAKEAGGITQHIGAYQIEKNNKKISFIDTPGHSAFSAMRSRGAKITDIIIIVVAADDGIKEQTKEAISHAKLAKIPIIIAINKIDKENANIERVKSQFSEMDIVPSDWGGEYDFVPLSAQTGEGIENLLSIIMLQAEISELVADEDRDAHAIVIESSLKKGFGPVANIIMKNGSLKVGDNIIVGTTFGKVKTIILDNGTQIKKIGPSTPASIIGLNEIPKVGESMISMSSEKEVRSIATKRAEYSRVQELSKSTKVTLDNFNSIVKEGKLTSLPIIIKTDVQGSLEAIKSSLEEMRNEEVKINIIYEGVGGITESDILLSQASKGSMVLGFNIKPTIQVKAKAKNLGIDIKIFSTIYELLDTVKNNLGGLMAPIISEEKIGEVEVKEIFVVAKIGTIAGSKVSSGVILRSSKVRLIRDSEEIITTTISSLKRFNDDVKEVKKGYDCGIMLKGFNDIQVGDIIEVLKEVQKKATL